MFIKEREAGHRENGGAMKKTHATMDHSKPHAVAADHGKAGREASGLGFGMGCDADANLGRLRAIGEGPTREGGVLAGTSGGFSVPSP